MQRDNTLRLKLTLFDHTHVIEMDIGRYENLLLQDVSMKQLDKEIRAAFAKLIKQAGIELANAQKGE